MKPQVITTQSLTNDANGIFEDQTTGAAGTLSLDGALVTSGVAYCYGTEAIRTQAQKISIEGTGNNSAIVATITGEAFGQSFSEDLTLANNGTATTTAYFETVTSITVDGAVTGNIEGGFLSTNGAATRPMMCDSRQSTYKQSITVEVISGTLTYTVQHSQDAPQDDYGTSNYSTQAAWIGTDGLEALSATADGNIAYPTRAVRLIFPTYTSGTVKITSIQGGP